MITSDLAKAQLHLAKAELILLDIRKGEPLDQEMLGRLKVIVSMIREAYVEALLVSSILQKDNQALESYE